MNYILIFITTFFFSCGRDGSFINEPQISSKSKKISDISIAEAEEMNAEREPDYLGEGDPAIIDDSSPPFMITGASLRCETLSKNTLSGSMKISCYLAKEGAVLEVDLLASDIAITDENKKNLVIDFEPQGDGTFLIEVLLTETNEIRIALETIQGAGYEQTVPDDFVTVIGADKIEATPEKEADAMAQSSDSSEESSATQEDPESEATDQMEEPVQLVGCASIGTPGSWVRVPGNPAYETQDFCVMKYEAKCSLADGQSCSSSVVEEIPSSSADNTPWVSLNQQEAEAKCNSIGQGYHLLTNEEWMTIGDNITNTGSNWTNGIVGDAQLKRGHSDNSPGQACAASSDDTLNVVEFDCTALQAANDDFVEQRTHTLSNGASIWDLSGNVWEWTSHFNNEEKPGPLGLAWNEFSSLTGTLDMPLIDLIT